MKLLQVLIKHILHWLQVGGTLWEKAIEIFIRSFLLVLVCFILIRIVTFLMMRLSRRMKSRDMRPDGGIRYQAITFAANILKYLIWIVGLFYFFRILGFDPAPIIASAGIAGIAIGFGLQSLAKDLVAGLFIMIDQSFTPGDYVEINGIQGTVIQVNLRMIALRDQSGIKIFIPTGTIGTVRNFPSPFLEVKFIIPLSLGVESSKALELIRKAIGDMSADFGPLISETPKVAALDAGERVLPAVAVDARLRPGQETRFKSELGSRLKVLFALAQIPWPDGVEILDVPIGMNKGS